MHPEIDNPEYEADDALYKYSDIGSIGFDLWQVGKMYSVLDRIVLMYYSRQSDSFTLMPVDLDSHHFQNR